MQPPWRGESKGDAALPQQWISMHQHAAAARWLNSRAAHNLKWSLCSEGGACLTNNQKCWP